MIDYDPHNWWEHFFDIKGSMLREIVPRSLVCALFGAGVVWVHVNHRPLDFPLSIHSLVGVALGLLLVFRTNSSYDRFWEGRKQWGAIVNETRNLARAGRVLLAKEPALLSELVRWTAAFAWATMHNLRGTKGLGPVGSLLPQDQVTKILEAQHIPLAIARRMSELILEARKKELVSDYVQMTLDQNVQLLIDYMGACERIQKTPLPFAYVVHLRRAVIFYCFTLPFATVKDFGWGAPVVAFVIAYTFFGIEEIGVEIENPFGDDDNDLPLERICTTIEKNVLALVDDLPRPA